MAFEEPSSMLSQEAISFPVTLNVYDLTEGFATINKVTKYLGTGVYHCGVEVHGTEYSYGQTEEDVSGVFQNDPRDHPVHVFKQSVSMQETCKTEREILQILEQLCDEWKGLEYHLLRHNCCDFSNELCKRLGAGTVPGWVKSAAGMGASVSDAVHLRRLSALVTRGKESRKATAEDGYHFGDLTRGVVAKVSENTASLVVKAHQTKGLGNEGGYHVADITRGARRSVSEGFRKVLSEGKQARDASPAASYRFGDFTRGLIANAAKR
jgi:hypothetical protein